MGPILTSPAGRIRLLSLTVRTTSITTEMVSFQLKRINVNHDLPIASAKRLRHGCSRHTGDLVAHLYWPRSCSSVSFSPCPFKRHKADGQTRGVELQHDWRQSTGRQSSQVRHCEIRNITQSPHRHLCPAENRS